MRTKFLTPNYFTATTATQTLNFPRLPVAIVATKSPPFSGDVYGELLRSAVSYAVDLELPNFPVDDALSKFYSDVLPHSIDIDFRGFFVDSGFISEIAQVQKVCSDAAPHNIDVTYGGSPVTSGVVSDIVQIPKQERKGDTGGDNVQNEPVIVQFEIPELSHYVENACMSEKENILFLSEVQENNDNLELLNVVPIDQFGVDAKDAVNSVETIVLECDITQKLHIHEGVDLLPNNSHPCETMFPLLEVDETGPADFSQFCVEDEWDSLLAAMEEHHSEYHQDIELNCQNLLTSVKTDILELISDSYTPTLPSESYLTNLDLISNGDFLQLVEAPTSKSNIGAENPDPFCTTFRFEEFEMVDSDSLDIFEALAIFNTVKEPRPCDSLFHSNKHFKSYEELIVSPELAVIDGTFTSMHVPILVDDEKIWTVQIILDAVLVEHGQLPFSTSDEIYLDWYLLGNDKCDRHVYATTEKLYSDLKDYKIKINLERSDCGVLVLDFLLSEYSSDTLNTIDDKLDMPPEGSETEKQRVNHTAAKRLLDNDSQIMGSAVKIAKVVDKVPSSNLSDDDDCQIIENHQLVRKGDLQEVTSSFESLPQVNDLDFFLNPRKASASWRPDQRLKPPVTKFMTSGDHKKPVAATMPLSYTHLQQFNVASGDTDTALLDGLLNFGPLTESLNIASPETSSDRNGDGLPVPVCRTDQESEAAQACDPDMIIIVNTENFDKEMIISRRGTYQKILSVEKRGVQVVERDLSLTIDIILDAVTCIVWYDSKNIGKKATAEDEGSSSVPLCIENIATNVLTSLSFTFTACVLVFEGDSNFLGTVMESADELYAAAASLGINIQVFCSYSPELTDEIILNYIGQVKKSCKGSLPRLPETETQAESFLTKSPSINPLSAHAILSCGCLLSEYLEWSGDCRIRAVRKYNLAEESVNLLSALFKYGEREEMKSGLTDCSSSVSSPLDSDKYVRKVNSANRKRKCIPDSSDAVYDIKSSTRSNKCINYELNHAESPSDAKPLKNPRVSLLKKLPDFTLDEEMFGDRSRPITAANMDYSKSWPETNVFGTVKVPQCRDDFAKSSRPVNDDFGVPKLGSANEIRGKGLAIDIHPDHEDFVGEVVDIFDKSPFRMDFQSAQRATKSSPLDYEAVDDHGPVRNSKPRGKLSFDNMSFLNFPNVDDMNTSCGLENNSSFKADNDYNGMDYHWNSNSFNHQPEQMGTGLFEKSMKNFRGPSSQEKFVPSHGEAPLSKAVHSAQLKNGSPCTMEFLNRIKEKRRLRQQNQPWGTPDPQPGNHVNSNHANILKGTKRRSSSILEYYKYQGEPRHTTPRKLTPQKSQKERGKLSNEKPSGLRPTWTPIDKRARRSLSFATNGSGGQTKLIWNDNISCSRDSRFSR